MKPGEFIADVNKRLARRGVPELTRAQETVIKERISRMLLFLREFGKVAREARDARDAFGGDGDAMAYSAIVDEKILALERRAA